MKLTDRQIQTFQARIWAHYERAGRHDLPWRQTIDPYHIFISEVMLQQTQVTRAVPKYRQFTAAFPDFEALAAAEFATVLGLWSGLGYNRRARYVHQAAKQVVAEHGGVLPQQPAELVRLPGVGPNTAGSIAAFAYNQPVVFIETNIRTVYLYHFFSTQVEIADSLLLRLIESTLNRQRPREWYWALMDYGAYLKQTHPNPSRASKHHVRQSRFEGSTRQLRGEILRQLLLTPKTSRQLARTIRDERLPATLLRLEQEGLVVRQGEDYRIA